MSKIIAFKVTVRNNKIGEVETGYIHRIDKQVIAVITKGGVFHYNRLGGKAANEKAKSYSLSRSSFCAVRGFVGDANYESSIRLEQTKNVTRLEWYIDKEMHLFDCTLESELAKKYVPYYSKMVIRPGIVTFNEPDPVYIENFIRKYCG